MSTDWVIQQLRVCAADPMWDAHAEVSKGLLNLAAQALEQATQVRPEPVGLTDTHAVLALCDRIIHQPQEAGLIRDMASKLRLQAESAMLASATRARKGQA